MEVDSALLNLIRFAIGTSAEISGFPALTESDFDAMFILALNQGVLAIAADGLQILNDSRPDVELAINKPEMRALRAKWFGSCFTSERKYSLNESYIAELARFYQGQGMRMLILKGYGLSLNYPIPSHRPIGDIDVFLRYDESGCDALLPAWKAGDEKIRERGIKVNAGHEHHTTFCFRGQLVENHYDFINTKAHRDAQKIETKLKEMTEAGCKEYLMPDGAKIYLPSADFNVIFLIRHLGQHFAGKSITLRQVMDWGLFLRAEGTKVHWDEVMPFLREMGIWNFFNHINAICSDFLGLELKDVPTVERNAEFETRILEDILHPEFSENKPEALLPVLAFKARRWWHNRWKHSLVYNESLLSMLLALTWSHLKRIRTIKD